ncbi:MAG: peptidoglycan DD-metalloendopeptidase family protein [Phycisphaerae bacterium]|nr:peptidoglycan DD-metalloendopeptidase family protein [Phycisphaerae bacterium]
MFSVLPVAIVALALSGGRGGVVQFGGGGPPATAHHCVPSAERDLVNARIAVNRERLGLTVGSFVPAPMDSANAGQGGVASGDPFDAILYRFWPQSGTWFQDLLPPGYVDDNAAAGSFHDYACHPFTYDGHAGIDSGIHTFEEQSLGVPVYAALDGVVIDAHDGEPDDNVFPQGTSNIVVIDHGLGRDTWYFHLKKNSVAVQVGQYVAAGTQVGLVGSSGYSYGPHLHFESRQLNQAFDPFAGACRSGASGFVSQPPESLVNAIVDAAITDVDLGTVPGPPQAIPHTGQVTLATPKIYLWLWTINLPIGSTWHFKVKRPNGTVAYDTGAYQFFNTDLYRVSWFWWNFDVAEMHTTTGEWSVDVLFNEQLMTTLPVTVNAVFNPTFNRAPAAITAAFEPSAPKFGDAITCRVSAPIVLDDLDYDVVRYQYVWKINGSIVRSAVSAGRSDMLPRNLAQPGQTVLCTVTPSDGKVNGALVAKSATLAALCPTDMNGDGKTDAADLAILLGAWGLCQ